MRVDIQAILVSRCTRCFPNAIMYFIEVKLFFYFPSVKVKMAPATIRDCQLSSTFFPDWPGLNTSIILKADILWDQHLLPEMFRHRHCHNLESCTRLSVAHQSRLRSEKFNLVFVMKWSRGSTRLTSVKPIIGLDSSEAIDLTQAKPLI